LCLILLTFLFTLTLHGLGTDLLVILLKGSKVLTALGELALLHTLTDVPVNECALGVHKIELVVNASEDLSNSGSVGDHAACALDLGKITTWDDGWWLVVDTALEAGWAPVDELDGALGLDGGDGGVDVLGDDITTVHHAASHVLTVTRVTLDHHGGGLEDGVGDLGDGELLVVGLLGGDDGGVRGEHKVDTRVRHQVGLELSHIDVEGTIETKRSGQRGDDLGNQTIEVGVGRALNVQVAAADIVDSLVIEHDADIGVLEKRVGRQDAVVRLNNGGGDLGGRVYGETELGLLAVIDGKTLKKERTETRTGTTTNGMEDQETLETSAVVGELADTVEGEVDNFLTNGVVTTGVVIGGIFLTRDQLLGVEQLAVSTSADFIDDSGLEIEEDGARDVLSSTSFREEGVESVITATNGLVGGHLAIRLDTVLEAVELPAGITDLDTGLTDVDGNDFAHC